MTPYRGPFNSELVLVVGDREIKDCVASTGMDLAMAAGVRIPNTAAEREALRVDSGDTSGGMSLASLQAGLKKRYDLDSRLLSGEANVNAALDAGMAIAGFGRYDKLPVEWRWQKRADFLHSMFFNRDTSVTRWRADPLAPPSNLGAAMPMKIVRAFLASGGWNALGVFEDSVGTTGGPNTGGEPMIKASGLIGSGHVVAGIPAGTDFFDGPGGARIGECPPTMDYIGLWAGDRAVVAVTGIPYADKQPRPTIVAISDMKGTIRAKTDAELAAQAAEYHACPPPPPDATPFSQAELDAAVAAEHERVRDAAIKAAQTL